MSRRDHLKFIHGTIAGVWVVELEPRNNYRGHLAPSWQRDAVRNQALPSNSIDQ